MRGRTFSRSVGYFTWYYPREPNLYLRQSLCFFYEQPSTRGCSKCRNEISFKAVPQEIILKQNRVERLWVFDIFRMAAKFNLKSGRRGPSAVSQSVGGGLCCAPSFHLWHRGVRVSRCDVPTPKFQSGIHSTKHHTQTEWVHFNQTTCKYFNNNATRNSEQHRRKSGTILMNLWLNLE